LVSGKVSGGLFSAGGNTTVAGVVNGSMRSVGGTISISGSVNQDLLAGCGNLTLSSGGHVGRDALMGAGKTFVEGHVGRNAYLGGGRVTIDGAVGGNVRGEARTLRVGDGALIGGDLTYASGREATIAQGATVRGKIVHEPFPEAHHRGPIHHLVAVLLHWSRRLIGFALFGLIFLLPFPEPARRAIATLQTAALPSLGIGVVLLVGAPFVALLALVIGFIIGGWWIGIGAMTAFLLSLALGFVTFGTFIGQWIFASAGSRNVHRVWAMLVGLVLLTLVGVVPILGRVIGALAAVFGLGAIVISLWGARRAGTGAVPGGAVAPPAAPAT
ncbi:MAG TPA: hypothetical protein VI792_06700, partial [Candidatus Eisenbacteria bacterium]